MSFGVLGRRSVIALALVFATFVAPQVAVAMKSNNSGSEPIVSESASYQPLTKLVTYNSNISTSLDLGAPAALTSVDVVIQADPGITRCDILLQRAASDTPDASFGLQLFFHAATGLGTAHYNFDPPVAVSEPLVVMTSSTGDGACAIQLLTRAREIPQN